MLELISCELGSRMGGSTWLRRIRGVTFKVNGQNQHHVGNSRHEAQRAATLLSAKAWFDVEVPSIIAVVGAQKGFTIKSSPRTER